MALLLQVFLIVEQQSAETVASFLMVFCPGIFAIIFVFIVAQQSAEPVASLLTLFCAGRFAIVFVFIVAQQSAELVVSVFSRLCWWLCHCIFFHCRTEKC